MKENTIQKGMANCKIVLVWHLSVRMSVVVGERITYQEGWGKKHCVVKVHSLHSGKILQEANHI